MRALAATAKKALVIGTTGFEPAAHEALREAARPRPSSGRPI